MAKEQGLPHTDENQENPITVSRPMSETLQIVNLSTYTLNEAEQSVLRRGLTFSPMLILDKFTLLKDLYFFCRNMTLKLLYSRPNLPAGIEEDDRQIFQDLFDFGTTNE